MGRTGTVAKEEVAAVKLASSPPQPLVLAPTSSWSPFGIGKCPGGDGQGVEVPGECTQLL